MSVSSAVCACAVCVSYLITALRDRYSYGIMTSKFAPTTGDTTQGNDGCSHQMICIQTR